MQKKGEEISEKTPVGLFSEINSIDTFYPADLNNDDFQRTINQYDPDLIIVYSYGKILPKKILDIPKLGSINIHCSILPKWKDTADTKAIQSDDKTTGVFFYACRS